MTYEASEASPSGRAEEIKTANIPEKITENDVSMERAERDGETGHSPLNYKGNLRNGIGYSLTSGGFFLGNTASCLINGKEESLKGRGLNVVVYDSSYGTIADKACFDLFRSSLRSSFHPWEGAENEETLHLYDRICDDARRISVLRGRQEKEGVLGYLEEYAGREDYAVFISVKDDASAKLTDEVRAAFEAYGLGKLSTIGKRDSYYAMVRDGDRITERLDHGGEPVRRSGAISCGSAGALSYELVSGGFDSGNVSSILINGTEYSPNSRGINIVIWDLMSNTEVVSTAFDSYADRMSLPEREGDDRSAQKAERGSR